MSEWDDVEEDANAGVRHFCGLLQRDGRLGVGASGLVAGCRSGGEALYLHRSLPARIVGVDLELGPRGARDNGAGLRLMYGDVLDLPFEDGAFDFAFYHHVIEHVDRPYDSIRELSRVVRPGGWLYVGTPNRHRIAGYVGSGAPLRDKLAWNLADYRARLQGRFRNELGAHAGFTESELQPTLRRHFTEVRWLTGDYLAFKYGGRVPAPLLGAVVRQPLRHVLAPAVYALCRR